VHLVGFYCKNEKLSWDRRLFIDFYIQCLIYFYGFSGSSDTRRGTRWLSAAWKAIPESIIVRSFKKCCISNALDGSEDDILWEDDGEDKDDSDWVTDSD
jgi:hypothetical protein